MEYIALFMGVMAGFVMTVITLSLPFDIEERHNLEKRLKFSTGIKRKFLTILYIIGNHKGLLIFVITIELISLLLAILSIGAYLEDVQTGYILKVMILFFLGYGISTAFTALFFLLLGVASTVVGLVRKGNIFIKTVIAEYKELANEKRSE